MISKAAFMINGTVLNYPGYYTHEQLYQKAPGELILVRFSMDDNRLGPFLFFPELGGLVVTIADKVVDYVEDRPVILTDTPMGTPMTAFPFFVSPENNCLHFRDLGYPYKDPLTGYIKRSLLIVPYRDAIQPTDEKTNNRSRTTAFRDL
jgi:hypothetical protein